MHSFIMQAGTRLGISTKILIALTGSALASDASYDNAPTADLELTIQGQIAPKCTVNIEADHTELDLTNTSGFADISVDVDCNEELYVELQSLNGGFELESRRKFSPDTNGFTSFIPYTANFSVDAPYALPLQIKSASMKGQRQGGTIGVVPFQTSGNLRLNWSLESQLYGGRYSDVIEIHTSSRGR